MSALLLLLIPVVCIFIVNIPPRNTAAKLVPWALGLTCLIQAALAVLSQLPVWAVWDRALTLPLDIELVIDPISAVILFLIALVTAVATAVGTPGGPRDKVVVSSLIMMCMIGMNGVVMVRDLFSLYVFIEITAVSTFIIIATQKSLAALASSFKYYILSGLATVSILVANAIVFMQIGSLAFDNVVSALNEGDLSVQIALVLFTVAFCIKGGMAPFGLWLPDAHSSGSSASSVLLSGIIAKVAGVYFVLRMMSEVLVGLHTPSLVFMTIGALSVVVGAFAAMVQTDFKRMLAFSSISQMGYIVLAAGLATPLAIIGAMAHFVAHALFKSQLFVNAGAVKEQVGTTKLDELSGLTERMPVTGWTSVIGFMSASGIPPLAGFWSKLLIIVALVQSGQWVFCVIAILASVATLGYSLILERAVFFGTLKEKFDELKEARWSLSGTALILAGLTVCLGLAFPLVLVFLSSQGLL